MDKIDFINAWVQQSRPKGKSGNIFFEGDTIYSYGKHFPIATITTAPNGEYVAFFTVDGHSPTTARHCSIVLAALRRADKVVVYKAEGSKTHFDNFMLLHNKARKPERYARELYAYLAQVKRYHEVMMTTPPAWALLPEGIEAGKALTVAVKLLKEDV